MGGTTYGYDPNGNMTSRASDAFTYNYENRLTQATVGSVVTQYVYNGDGARVKKTVGGTTTYYVGNWYEVTNGVVTKYYYFGAQRVAMKTASGVTYLHGDHLGSTSVASTNTGAFHSRQTYYAFGVPRTTEGTLPTDYTFTGQRADNSAGLMYYGARYYDSAIGRFVSADTVVPGAANPQNLNRYSYVLNNPIRLTDPSGHCPVGDKEDECWIEYGNATKNIGFTPQGLADWETGALRNLNEWILSGVEFSSKPHDGVVGKAWTAGNLNDVMSALSKVKSTLGSKTKEALGLLNGGKLVFNAVSTGGRTDVGAIGGLSAPGTINLNLLDNSNTTTVHTILHEIGHIIDWNACPGCKGGWSENSTDWQSATGWGKYKPYNMWINPGAKLQDVVRQYSLTGPGEDFADTFMWYVDKTFGNQPSIDRRDAVIKALRNFK